MSHLDGSVLSVIFSVLCLIANLWIRKEVAELRLEFTRRDAEQWQKCQEHFVAREVCQAIHQTQAQAQHGD